MKRIYIITASLLFALTAMQAQERKQPVAGPAPIVNVEKPHSFTLKNGLKVLVVENHKLPRVTYTLTIDAPLYAEGAKAGVSSITSEMIGSGTTKMTKEQFNDEVDFLGANVRFWSSGAVASGLSKYSETLLNLMADGALNTVFTQEEFEKIQAKAIEGVKASDKSVTAIANRVENAVLFGKNHPAGEFETEESFQNVTLQDTKDFYSKFYTPENAYLVIVGDVDYKKTEKLVNKLFGSWKKGKAETVNYAVNPNVSTTEINFIDMPNAVQSEIALVNTVELKMTDKDYFAALMANQILGGGGEGRLFLNLREAHGWTYGAYSSTSTARKYPGKFKATASVRNAVTDSAVVEFFNEVDKIRKELAADDELKLAKAKFVGNFVMEIQKPETIARFALNKELYGLPNDFYENYIKNINAVTVEDVQKAAQKYFLKDNIRVVIAGKGSEVLKGLEGLNMPINYFDKLGDQVEKPEFNKEVAAGVTVQTVLKQYIDAIGGEAALKGVKSMAMKASGVIQGMQLDVVSKVTNKGEMLVEQSMMGAVMSKQVVTPTKGYMTMQGQTQEFSEEDLVEMRKMAVPFAELVQLTDADLTLTGIESINGKEAYAIKSGKVVSYYDVETGLKTATFTTVEQGGQVAVQEVYYGDYQEVKGIKFPFTTTMNVGIEIELKTSEVKINEGVTAADFN